MASNNLISNMPIKGINGINILFLKYKLPFNRYINIGILNKISKAILRNLSSFFLENKA